jgi:hypothetical protein
MDQHEGRSKGFHHQQSNERQRRPTADKKSDKEELPQSIPPIIYGHNLAAPSSLNNSAASHHVNNNINNNSNKLKRKIGTPNPAINKTNSITLVPDNDDKKDYSNDKQRNYPYDFEDSEITYISLLRYNRAFRLFLMSYIVAHLGEWLTYLASISAIEEIQRHNGAEASGRMAVSLLIVIRLLPNVILSPFGGALADGWDRRNIMMTLDMCGVFIAWLFVMALHQKSVPLIYVATLLQECVAGLYEPSRSAIIPLMCPGNEEMKKATTLAGVAWSMIAAFGSAIGGLLVTLVGIHGCYSKCVSV